MITTLLQMTAIIACGVLWRCWQPANLNAELTGRVLSSTVFHLFLPALVFEVISDLDIGLHTLQYTVLGMSSIILSVIVMMAFTRVCKFKPMRSGAVILAASFPNVTYLGLPVLQQTYGQWARAVAIQLDVFAASPLVLSLGILIAVHYGDSAPEDKKTFYKYLNTPPFWAALVATMLNLDGIVLPPEIMSVFSRLGDAVVPLMLLSLGLSLNWRTIHLNNLPYILPVVVVKLVLMPLLALWLLSFMTFENEYRSACLLEMAMPSMILGVVYCQRYGLDTELYAMSVTVTTLLSLVSLPIWFQVAS